VGESRNKQRAPEGGDTDDAERFDTRLFNHHGSKKSLSEQYCLSFYLDLLSSWLNLKQMWVFLWGNQNRKYPEGLFEGIAAVVEKSTW
jgi:hypothetical protein